MRRNSAAACTLAALLIASATAAFLLQQRGWDASALVVAGDQFSNPSDVPATLSVERNSAGYDGQFYYRLALDPFTRQWTDFGIRFDYPTYRQQRIFFPLVVWILSLGNAAAVPWLFVIVNIASVGLLAWSTAKLIRDAVNPWWSALVWLYPGWALSMARDCVEILEVALLVSAALALRRRRFVVAALLGTCAVLTKETALIGIAALSVAHLAALPFVMPIAAHFGFKMLLFRLWHATPALGLSHFAIPLAGFIASARTPHPLLWWFEVGLLGAIGVLALASLRRAPRPPVFAWIVYVPLLAVLDQSFWVEHWSFMRAASEYGTFAALIVATRVSRCC
jgi:hypothetical protein